MLPSSEDDSDLALMPAWKSRQPKPQVIPQPKSPPPTTVSLPSSTPQIAAPPEKLARSIYSILEELSEYFYMLYAY